MQQQQSPSPLSARCADILLLLSWAALFFAGFALLPWLWAVNVWMFWPGLRQGDPVVKTCKQVCRIALLLPRVQLDRGIRLPRPNRTHPFSKFQMSLHTCL
eukprot:GHRR01001599.1.p1 GENE.GHRR01001599.1~~GHRR01001599.1.p1  ORF type:complete len:101 (-),score=0.03 GHRR01001599.1:1162-1464(-)